MSTQGSRARPARHRTSGWLDAIGAAVTIAAAVVAVVRIKRAVNEHFARDQDDFAIFYRTGSRLFNGEANPYERIGAPNLNPPHAHVLLAPVLPWRRPVAYGVWLSLTGAALAISAALTLRVLPQRPRRQAMLAAAALIGGSGLTMATVTSGQIYGVLNLPLTVAWLAARERNDRLAGLLIGSLATVKPNLAIVILGWIRQGNWRAASASVAAAAATGGAGLAAFGHAPYVDWMKSLSQMVLSGHFRDGALLQFLARTSRPTGHFEPIANVSTAMVLRSWWLANAVLTSCSLRSGIADVDRWWLRMLTLSFLISPKGWMYGGWWLLGPGLSVASSGSSWSRRLLGFGALALWLPDRAPTLGRSHRWVGPSWGSLYFWAWFAGWLSTWRSRQV